MLPVSATYTFPEASTANPSGPNCPLCGSPPKTASRPGPLSPLYQESPVVQVPAIPVKLPFAEAFPIVEQPPPPKKTSPEPLTATRSPNAAFPYIVLLIIPSGETLTIGPTSSVVMNRFPEPSMTMLTGSIGAPWPERPPPINVVMMPVAETFRTTLSPESAI